MPFTELKIDKSFVGACQTDPEAWKIVRATLSLARELGMRVVAEGIETAAINDRLRDAGCEMGQGWHSGRPMRADGIMARLNQGGDLWQCHDLVDAHRQPGHLLGPSGLPLHSLSGINFADDMSTVAHGLITADAVA
jgi:predicted signal transduction protein with EAL and GGDEF domain